MPSNRRNSQNSIEGILSRHQKLIEDAQTSTPVSGFTEAEAENRINLLEAKLRSPSHFQELLKGSIGPGLAPGVPENLRVSANVGFYDSTNAPKSRVTLEWDAAEIEPTLEEPESAIADQYEIWSRRVSGGALTLDTSSASTSAIIEAWEPGAARWVTVRARYGAGLWSQYAPEIQVIPESPEPIVPATPTGFSITENAGFFTPERVPMSRVTYTWSAVTQSTEGGAVDVSNYQLWERFGTNPWTLSTETINPTATLEYPAGSTREVRVRALSTLGVYSGYSSSISFTPSAPVATAPQAPTGLVASDNVGTFLLSGRTTSHVTLSWTPVVLDVNNNPTPIREYEVIVLEPAGSGGGTVARPIGRTATTSMRFETPTSLARSYVVCAASTFGVWSETSVPLDITGAVPVQINTPPTAPTLATARGTVTVSWDGQLTTGAPPAQYWQTRIQVSYDSGTTWQSVGVPITSAGVGAVVVGTVGATIHARLLWADTLGRVSTPSVATSIVVDGVGEGDIEQSVIDAIEQAQTDAANAETAASAALTAANGKNKIYYQTTQPSGGTYLTGDSWFDTDDGYKLYVYNGSTWQLAQDAAGALSTANTKNRTFIQGTAPTATAAGDIWIDTANGNQLKRWSGSAWVDARDTTIATAQTAANNALTAANGKNKNYYQATQPTGGTYLTGDSWFDTDDNYKLYVYNGSTWQLAQDSATAISTANTANTTAGNALTAANGKNKVWHQAAQPDTTGNTVGDTWFDSDDGNKIYEWSGSAWVANELGTNALADLAITNAKILDGTILNAKIADGTIQTAKIGDAQITNAKIADATIQSAKIAALDAGKITSGTIDAQRIGAATISAEKLTIGAITDNLVSNGGFEDGFLNWSVANSGGTGGSVAVTTTASEVRSGTTSLKLIRGNANPAAMQSTSAQIPVAPGQVYRVAAYARSTATLASGFYLRVNWYTETGAAASTANNDVQSNVALDATWTEKAGTATAPSNAKYARISVINANGTSTILVDDISMRALLPGSVIVNGTVTATQMAAGTITAASGIIADAAITNAKIADGTIDNAKISTLDAGKITTGTISADRIGADSISVNKLLVASLDNLIQAPSFETTSAEAWELTNGAVNGTTLPRSGSRALAIASGTPAVMAKQTNGFAVEEGESYRIGGWVRLASGTSALDGVIMRVDYGGTNATATTNSADIAITPNGTGTAYVQIAGTWVVPAGAKFARVVIVRRDSNAGKTYYLDDAFAFKMASSELIVDGAITTRTLAAGAITADKIGASEITGDKIAAGTIEVSNLSSGVGQALDITSNGSVNIIVQQQAAVNQQLTEQADHITSLENDVNGVGGVAEVASEAQSVATSAQETATNANNLASTVNDQVSLMGQTYRFTATGAFISAQESPYEFVIQNTGAEIRYNGVMATRWDYGTMQVNNFTGNSIKIGQHMIEGYGTNNGTVVRFVG